MSTTYTGNKVFAPTIFFIAFRESLEAALVIGILSGMLERIVEGKSKKESPHLDSTQDQSNNNLDDNGNHNQNSKENNTKLIKKLRRYVFAGALSGLLIAFIIGAAFLAVFYTQTTDLYGRSEELWEGRSWPTHTNVLLSPPFPFLLISLAH